MISNLDNEDAWLYLEKKTPKKLLLVTDGRFPAKNLLDISEKLKELGVIEINLLTNQRNKK